MLGNIQTLIRMLDFRRRCQFRGRGSFRSCRLEDLDWVLWRMLMVVRRLKRLPICRWFRWVRINKLRHWLEEIRRVILRVSWIQKKTRMLDYHLHCLWELHQQMFQNFQSVASASPLYPTKMVVKPLNKSPTCKFYFQTKTAKRWKNLTPSQKQKSRTKKTIRIPIQTMDFLLLFLNRKNRFCRNLQLPV